MILIVQYIIKEIYTYLTKKLISSPSELQQQTSDTLAIVLRKNTPGIL